MKGVIIDWVDAVEAKTEPHHLVMVVGETGNGGTVADVAQQVSP